MPIAIWRIIYKAPERVLSQSSIFGQNPKIWCQEFNDLEAPKVSKKQLCDGTPRCRIPGTPPGRGQRRSRLHLHPSVVRRHHGDSPRAVGTARKAGGVSPPATRPPRALWGLPRAAQPPAWGDPSHPAQQGLDGEEAHTGTPYWPWARLLGRVCGLEMATCPFCRRGTLRIMAVITQESVMTRILRHLQLASVPPPIAPARYRQEGSVFN